MPTLSVLMPARNGASYLSASIRSTLAALPPRDAELVVLDDASTDSTPVILERWASRDSRLRVHHAEQNLGVAAALNWLLDRTDSDLVARMDADDVTLPHRFRSHLPLMERHDIVFGASLWLNQHGRPIGIQHPLTMGPPALALCLLMGNFLAHDSMIARRSAIASVGGYRAVASEDYDLWLRSLNGQGRLLRTGKPVIAIRRHRKRTVLNPDWTAQRRRDATANGALYAPYSSLCATTLGTDSVPIQWLRFALYQGADDPIVEMLLGRVKNRIRDLSGTDRFASILHYHRATNRLKHGRLPRGKTG